MTDAPDAALPVGDPSDRWREDPDAATGTDRDSERRRRGTEQPCAATLAEDR